MFPTLSINLPWETSKVLELPARTLAYIGDSVFELGIRLKFAICRQEQRVHSHKSVIPIVCARNQSALFDVILKDLSEEEQGWLKMWRNAKQPYTPRSVPRGLYAKSTAFEAWVGFLFLTGQIKRLEELFQTANDGLHNL
ncbi:ribonuclease III [bacterium]|nr:ribonuclease III [bacterium]